MPNRHREFFGGLDHDRFGLGLRVPLDSPNDVMLAAMANELIDGFDDPIGGMHSETAQSNELFREQLRFLSSFLHPRQIGFRIRNELSGMRVIDDLANPFLGYSILIADRFERLTGLPLRDDRLVPIGRGKLLLRDHFRPSIKKVVF
jgi:hypothetical protein